MGLITWSLDWTLHGEGVARAKSNALIAARA